MRFSLQLVVALLLLSSATLFAQSYRGVFVGQRSDLLPTEFDAVSNTEFTGQFGNERMEIFVNGVLVTGFKVVPLVPLTMAEAVAKHGSIGNIPKMLTILDYYGDSQGVADPIRKIAYLSSSLSPDAVISSVGYYDTNQAMLLWLGDPGPGFLQVLQIAASNVSLQEVNARPRVGSVQDAARFMVTQTIKAADSQGQEVGALIKAYAQSCSDTQECIAARRKQLEEIRRSGDAFHARIARAEETYASNADLLNNTRPAELDRLEQAWKDLVPKVRQFMAELNK